MSTNYSSNDVLNAIAAASKALSARKEEVNRLNVFPVPDGDTGTNMSLTIESVVTNIARLPIGSSGAEARKAITTGALMGARGNSGVITSQILRGLCEGSAHAEALTTDTVAAAFEKSVEVAFQAVRKPVEGTILTVLRDSASAAGSAHAEALTTDTVAAAFEKSVEVAFQAVRKPVEGTILTVLRDSASAAVEASELKLDTEAALETIVSAAYDSVQRTPELLPVLKENGVVDAGGFGLAILFDAFVSALLGKDGTLGDELAFARTAAPKVEIEQINDWEGSAFRYCNEFLVDSDVLDPAEALEFLATMGDCELCVGSVPKFKVHVHSNHPDQVLAYFLERGQISEVFIHNMQLQSDDCELCVGSVPKFKVHVHSNHPDQVLAYFLERGQISEVFIHNMQLQSEERTEKLAAEQAAERKPIGFVAVAAGSGNAEILKSLGVDVVVSGGQTMNPSTKDLLDAMTEVNADAVIVMPNKSGNAEILKSLGVDVVVSGGQTMNPSTKDLLDAMTEVNADAVIVMPNNSNIIMAAQSACELADFPCGVVPTSNIIMAAQSACELADFPCGVVPTKSMPQAFAAMFAVDQEASLEDNVEEMTEAYADVKTGEVTTAIKDSKDAHDNPIKEGDVIGISDGAIEAVASTVEDAVMRLLEVMEAEDADTLTILAGEDFSDEDLEALEEKIEQAYEDIEIDSHRGGQPLYPIISRRSKRRSSRLTRTSRSIPIAAGSRSTPSSCRLSRDGNR